MSVKSNAVITLPVLKPRKGNIRVSYDGDGMWHVQCDYFHNGMWIYDGGLMTTEHIKNLTGKELVAP